ncbi:MAG TPA: YCF48-related protein, partial [Chloroflexota bacterium]
MSPAWELVSDRPGGTVSSLVVSDTGVLAITTAAAHRSINGGATWATLSAGRVAPPLNAVAQCGTSIFVGGQRELCRSRDLGYSWSTVLSGAVVCLGVVRDGQTATLLAGTQADGMLRSADGGDTWASANPGLLDLTVLCLATASTGVSFAGTPTGVYRSANAGRAWRELELPCGPVGVECLAASNELVLVGTDSAGAFVSRDSGRSWSPIAGLTELATTALAIGRDGALLALGCPDRVYLSDDGGQRWRFDTVGTVLSLAWLDNCLLAGVARDGVLKLDLGTGQWRSSSDGLSGRVIVDLAYNPQTGALLTADLEGAVERSTDSGRTWHPIEGPMEVSRLAVTGEAMCAAATTGLYVTRDDGSNWSPVHSQAAARSVAAVSSGAALAAFDDQQLLLLSDSDEPRCLEWDAARGRIVAVALFDAETLFVGTLGDQTVVWHSTDGGRTWAAWLRADRAESLCLGISPTFGVDQQILVGAGERIWRPLRQSRERSGAEVRPLWLSTSLGEAITSVAFGATPATVYAGTTAGVQRSLDGGQQFTPWSA